MTLEYSKGDKLRYIGEPDISFSTNRFSYVIDLINSLNIVVIQDDDGLIHKYSEHVVRRNFITVYEYREKIIDLILKC